MAYISEEHQQAILAALAYTGIGIACLVLATLAILISLLTLVLIVSLLGKLGRRVKPDGRKAILITGGSSGIGLVVAKHLFRLGFSVIVGYYNDQEPGYRELVELRTQADEVREGRLDESVSSIRQSHLFLVRMDVTSLASIESADVEISKLLEEFDLQLYALINNAGVWLDNSFEWTSKESIKRTIDTNVSGVLLVTRQFASKIIRAKGKLIHVSSIAAKYPVQGMSVYGSSKSLVGYFSDAVGEDLRDYGVVSVSIHPGNLMANSNIMLARSSSSQRAVEKLSDEERELYKKSIEKQSEFNDKLLRMKFKNSSENQEELANVFQFKMPSMDVTDARESLWSRFIGRVLSLIEGRALDKSLEDTGLLTAFEDAVTLERPPGHLYAGSRIFSLVFGPLCEFLPPHVARWLSVGLGRNIFDL